MRPPRCLVVSCLVAQVICVPGFTQNTATRVSTDVAKAACKEFHSEFRTRNSKRRLAAVDRLAAYEHPLVARSLGKALGDPNETVRAFAATSLGRQQAAAAVGYLKRAARVRRNQTCQVTMAALLGGMRAHRCCPPLKELRKLFRTGTKELQREVVLSLRYARGRDTVKFLAPMVDLPQPANVDDPSNPPASYWKDRVERWNYWYGALAETLVHLTGVEFDESAAVRAWLRGGGKILDPKAGQAAVDAL